MISDLDLVARLRDLHPPPAPAWWPLAPGWWAALLLLAVLAVIVFRYAPPWWRRLRLRRRLIAALETIARRHRGGAPAAVTIADTSSLLRRAALIKFPHGGVAGLHGGDWIAFLESHDRVPGRFAALDRTLTVAPYCAPETSADAEPLLDAAQGWLRAVL